MPIYQSCIYRQNLHTYHMLFIHGNNIKISSHGLINNSTSNGLHTIIFHIIHTSMLTHQLACINISFSNTHFKPFNSTITFLLSFTHHSCSSCQATTHKQFHMDHFGPTTIRTVFLTVSNRAVGCPLAALSPNIGSMLWNRNPWPFLAQQHQNHNLTHNYNTRGPFPARDQSGTVQTGPKNFNNSVPSFGTDQTAIHGLKHSKPFTRLLKLKITE